MTPEEFRRSGYELIDRIAEYLADPTTVDHVVPDIRPGDVRAMLPEHPPAEPETWETVSADIDRVIMPTIANWQHPAWFAYFPANNSYASVLGELLSAGIGGQGMVWVSSPAMTEVETLMLDWMQELLGLPTAFRSTTDTGGGVIQGSASEGNLVAALAARWRATEGRINIDGDTSKLVAYCSAQSHSSVEKGLRIAGIGENNIRIVRHDAGFAMDAEHFAELVAADVAAGLNPFYVCATHGTTSSMAFDPTAEIAPLCREHGIWLHVDAAMSGLAALAPEFRWVNAGLDRVDSYCTDPHKWMGINFDCSLWWTTDRQSLLGALSILPEYLRYDAAESGNAIDYRDWQIPLGRRFRALKLWFSLRLDGTAALQQFIRRDVELTQRLAQRFSDDDRFEIVAPHPLNLVCVAVVDDDAEQTNARTDTLIDAINASEEATVTRTVLDGRVVMRVSVGAKTTEQHHLDAFWKLLQGLL